MSVVFDALVLGNGLPALRAALDLAETDLRVALVAPVRQPRLPGEPELDHEQGLSALIERIAEPLAGPNREAGQVGPGIRRVAPVPALLQNAAGEWLRQSEPEVFGIPAVPLSAESISLLGTGAALRAYLDRVTPVLTIGKAREFGRLARRRLGHSAFERLVEPQLRDRFGTGDVEVSIAAPGLNEALTRTGALTAAALAYSERHVARETRVQPEDDWDGLLSRLLRRLEFYGVTLLEGEISSVHRAGEFWEVRTSSAEGGETLRGRAMLVDFDAAGESGAGLGQLLPASLLPERVRVYASAGIEAPEGLGPMAGPAPVTAIRTVADAGSGAPWSLRLELRGEGGWTAHLSGPATLDATGELREESATTLRSVRALAEGLRLVPTSDWRLRVAAAPFADVAQRETAGQRLEAVSVGESAPLWLGRGLHGDSLSAALDDAHRRAIHLRRRLLGLEPD